MPAPSHRLALAVSLVLLASAVSGCSSPAAKTEPRITPVPVESTAPETSGVAISSGAISKVLSGSVLRDELFEAAADGLGTSSDQFTAYQLYEQGTAAVGDLKPAGGGSRVFVAFTGGPDDWKMAWSAPFGSSECRADVLVAAAPGVSAELAGSIDWDKKEPRAKRPSSTAVAPTLSSFKKFALRSAAELAGAEYEGGFTIEARIAQDSTGRWWGNAIAQPDDDGLEAIGIWGSYGGATWTGEIADFGSEDGETGFFPADVLAKLRL